MVLSALYRPNRTNVWFSFGYDTNMLAKYLSKEQKILLFKSGDHKIVINDYEVFLFPKKILKITPLKNHTAVHADTFGFFQKSYEKTLSDWKISVPDIVTRGKTDRVTGFSGWSSEDKELYNLT